METSSIDQILLYPYIEEIKPSFIDPAFKPHPLGESGKT